MPKTEAAPPEKLAKPDPLPIEFVPLSPPEQPGALPRLRIVSPKPDQAVPVSDADATPVRLELKGWGSEGSGTDVLVKLDDFYPRALSTLPQTLTLGALVPANKRLEPGEHELFVVAVRADRTSVKPLVEEDGAGKLPEASPGPYDRVHFRVGAGKPEPKPPVPSQSEPSQSEPKPSAPELVLLEPRGTYNGSLEVVVDFYLLNASLGPESFWVRVSVEGEGKQAVHQLDTLRPLRVEGLPSGDYTFTLELHEPGESGKVRSSASRTITVNRDAPVEAEE